MTKFGFVKIEDKWHFQGELTTEEAVAKLRSDVKTDAEETKDTAYRTQGCAVVDMDTFTVSRWIYATTTQASTESPTWGPWGKEGRSGL